MTDDFRDLPDRMVFGASEHNLVALHGAQPNKTDKVGPARLLSCDRTVRSRHPASSSHEMPCPPCSERSPGTSGGLGECEARGSSSPQGSEGLDARAVGRRSTVKIWLDLVPPPAARWRERGLGAGISAQRCCRRLTSSMSSGACHAMPCHVPSSAGDLALIPLVPSFCTQHAIFQCRTTRKRVVAMLISRGLA